MICPRCGQPNPSAAPQCAQCGYFFDGEPETVQTREQTQRFVIGKKHAAHSDTPSTPETPTVYYYAFDQSEPETVPLFSDGTSQEQNTPQNGESSKTAAPSSHMPQGGSMPDAADTDARTLSPASSDVQAQQTQKPYGGSPAQPRHIEKDAAPMPPDEAAPELSDSGQTDAALPPLARSKDNKRKTAPIIALGPLFGRRKTKSQRMSREKPSSAGFDETPPDTGAAVSKPATAQSAKARTRGGEEKVRRRVPVLLPAAASHRKKHRKPTKTELAPVMSMPADTRRRHAFARLFVRLLLLVALVAVSIWALYRFYPNLSDQMRQDADNLNTLAQADITYQVDETIQSERDAHKITFFSTKYESVYIQELQKTYLFSAGQAHLVLFDDEIIGPTPQLDQIEVSLTPVFYTPSGQRFAHDPIVYTLPVPVSPVGLIKPAQSSVTSQSSLYTLEFSVEPGSTVFVQGENVSDFADQNGVIVHNVTLADFGDNQVLLQVQAPGKLATQVTLTINRPYMDVPIELNGSFTFSTSKYLTITGTTLPGASISLDAGQNGEAVVRSDGSFEIQALLSKFGENEVVLRAKYPGKEDSTYTLTVEYSPKLDEYSKQAWPMDEKNLEELYATPSSKVGKIYVASGTVLSASEDELPVYTIALDNGAYVNIQMVKGKTLTSGTHYQIFCDFDCMLNDMPLFIGRYYFEK